MKPKSREKIGHDALTFTNGAVYISGMEDFINEIREYAAAVGKEPSTVVQQATRKDGSQHGLGGTAWTRWVNGGGCTVETMVRIRRFMADNPPAENAA